ncbi:MAG: glycoside hydrolase family 65 protein [Clostridia bacterium]|nr:glycoside hydrolase family 65 protein [Clostridia bacterium]
MSDVRIKPWSIEHSGPVTEYTQSIFTIGNGYVGVRGFSTQEKKNTPCDHAIFRAGLYEQVKPGITDLVQLPDVLHLSVGFGDVVEQSLNLQDGVLTQCWQNVRCERMVSMADPQLLCVRWTISAGNAISIENHWDANVRNMPVHDDQMVDSTETIQLLETVSSDPRMLCMQTVHSHRKLTFAQELLLDGQPLKDSFVQPPCVLEKRIRILVDDEKVNPSVPDPWEENCKAWQVLWRDCDIQMEAADEWQGALRYNIFQLLCNNASGDPNVSIGARGLTHGRYKGNTFWDTDIFLFPFYCWHRPEAAKNLAQYRLNRLEDAKALAKKQNLSGARFPWMCSTDGLEQCESWDIGFCETHITADVAYAIHRYTEITGEPVTPQMQELFWETARFWQSRFTWEEEKQQYSTFFVKGPDEYCGAAINNTYTNYMAKHNVHLALQQKADESLQHFANHIKLLYDPDRKLYLQDELFERLEPLPLRHESGQPLYKTICFDRMQRYRALKQADLVQLMVLFPNDFTPEQKRAVWDYYEPLTVHDSTLSFGVHAHLAFQLGLMEEAWGYWEKSLFLDLRDVLGNTGREGIHMAALGASWQALVYGALGLWTENGQLNAQPHLPREIKSLSLCLYHQGQRLRITATHQDIHIEKEA